MDFNMENYKKKRGALYMLISLCDANNGCLDIENGEVIRVFNDAEDIVKIEYQNGKIGLLADAEFETMDRAIRDYQNK